jgi:hypothetical protein
MSQSDKVVYLNRGAHPLLAGTLISVINSLPAKLQKAPPDQWIATLKSQVSKGAVKQPEIDDCEVIPWLEMRKSIKEPITREELLKAINTRQVTVKEVALGSPQYKSYSHKGFASSQAVYTELLFIGNSEKANMEDRIAEVEWELEQFNFDISRLSEDPDAVFRLEQERSELMRDSVKAYDFRWSHFSENISGKHGKNLFAHGRELVDGPMYLVDEVQSDWGQQGRIKEWKGISKAPFVTDTKLWAGLVMRRMMQRAALNPAVEKFYWIRGSMSNGGARAGPSKLDEFYLKVMSGIVDRVIGPAGQKCRMDTLRFSDGTSIADVPCFDMTPAVRERLKQSLPLYSLTSLLPRPRVMDEPERESLMKVASSMIGSVRHVRMVNHLYDVATAKEIAGSYISGLVQVSLRAKNPEQVMRHECFHFAHDKLMSYSERAMITREFSPGTPLNIKVRSILLKENERAAADQCLELGIVGASEAAAHGFTLWSEGRLDLEESPAKGLFEEIRIVVADVIAWFKRAVQDEKITTVEGVFKHLAAGGYSQQGDVAGRPLIREMEVLHSQRDRESGRVDRS